MAKISIIVPIYNAGPYLKKCLDSLVNQTLKDIEIICVLDCPTDGSGIIAKQYAAKDNRIKIVENKSNLHVGESRNVGLSVATGDFIGFVDDDDYCEQNMFELLYENAIREHALVASCNRDCIDMINNTCFLAPQFFYKKNNSCYELLKQVLTAQLSSNAFVIWNKIYKTDFISNNKIKFLNTKYYSGEDAIFNITIYSLLIQNNSEIIHCPQVLYHHVFHTHNTGKSALYTSNQIKFRDKLSQTMINSTLYNDLCSELYIGNIRYLYTMFLQHHFKLRTLYDYPNICSNILKCWTSYNRNLTIPKNLFAAILRLSLSNK